MCYAVINVKFKAWELVLFSPRLELIDSLLNLNFISHGSHILTTTLQCNVINYIDIILDIDEKLILYIN